MPVYHTTIKLHDTDAAGVLFFANQLKIIHDAYEALMESIGFSLRDLIDKKDFFLPIVHSESDYTLPLVAGERVEIRTEVDSIGKTSFTLSYKVLNASGQAAGLAKTVHVSVNKTTHEKIPIPDDLRAKLKEV